MATITRFLEFMQVFPNEDSCIQYLEKKRWKDRIISPFDSTSTVYKCKGHKYRCKNTGKYFTVKTNTIFAKSKIPLIKWLYLIFIYTKHKRSLSSHQAARDLGVTQKTAWYMMNKLRELTKRQNESSPEDFAAVIWGCEIDESYIGGKNKNRHKNKKVEKCQGRSYKDKVPVFGILQRNGKLIAKVVERTDMEHLLPIIKKYIKKGSVIYTDGLEYSGITDDYIIRSVNHSARLYGYFEFDETDAMIMVCNNGIENAWSHLKRTIFGTYYHVSRKYMQKYVDEYVFRFNTRKLSDSDRFHLYLQYIYAA